MTHSFTGGGVEGEDEDAEAERHPLDRLRVLDLQQRVRKRLDDAMVWTGRDLRGGSGTVGGRG